jgi:hypothetical protein
MLALRGVPGIYFHSLFGSENWQEGVEKTGQNRTINRQKLNVKELEQGLSSGLRQLVFDGYKQMLLARRNCPAFHPNGGQSVLDLHAAVVVIQRIHAGEDVYCLHNVSDQTVKVSLPTLGILTDLISGRTLDVFAEIELKPYEFLWLSK